MAATITFQLEGTLCKTQELPREIVCATSEVLRALIAGEFAESMQSVIIQKPTSLMKITNEHDCLLWANFWTQVVSNAPTFTDLTTDDVCIMSELCDIYEINHIIKVLQRYIASSDWPITNETMHAACEVNAIELLLSNNVASVRDIPAKIVELFEPEDALRLLVNWQRKLTERTGELQFLDIANASWPAALGAPIITDTNVIFRKLAEMMALPTDALIAFMRSHSALSIAGGATLDAVSLHETRGKGAADVDMWAPYARCEASFTKFRNDFIDFIKGPENRSVLIARKYAIMNFATIGNPHNIQLINCTATCHEEILMNFDMPAVHISIGWNHKTDAPMLLCSADFIYCMITGIVPWTDIENIQAYRIEKYKRKGFTFVNETTVRSHCKPLQPLVFTAEPTTTEEAIDLCNIYRRSYNKLALLSNILGPISVDMIEHNDEYVDKSVTNYIMKWTKRNDPYTTVLDGLKYNKTNQKFDTGYVKMNEFPKSSVFCSIPLTETAKYDALKLPKTSELRVYNPKQTSFTKRTTYINVKTGEIYKCSEHRVNNAKINEDDEIRIVGTFWKTCDKDDEYRLIGETILIKPKE
mgnify:CR=1 FL=1